MSILRVPLSFEINQVFISADGFVFVSGRTKNLSV